MKTFQTEITVNGAVMPIRCLVSPKGTQYLIVDDWAVKMLARKNGVTRNKDDQVWAWLSDGEGGYVTEWHDKKDLIKPDALLELGLIGARELRMIERRFAAAAEAEAAGTAKEGGANVKLRRAVRRGQEEGEAQPAVGHLSERAYRKLVKDAATVLPQLEKLVQDLQHMKLAKAA